MGSQKFSSALGPFAHRAQMLPYAQSHLDLRQATRGSLEFTSTSLRAFRSQSVRFEGNSCFAQELAVLCPSRRGTGHPAILRRGAQGAGSLKPERRQWRPSLAVGKGCVGHSSKAQRVASTRPPSSLGYPDYSARLLIIEPKLQPLRAGHVKARKLC